MSNSIVGLISTVVPLLTSSRTACIIAHSFSICCGKSACKTCPRVTYCPGNIERCRPNIQMAIAPIVARDHVASACGSFGTLGRPLELKAMDEFLRSTDVIDWTDPTVLGQAAVLRDDVADQIDVARRCFEFVR